MARQGNQSEYQAIATQWAAAKEKQKFQASLRPNGESTPSRGIRKTSSTALSEDDPNRKNVRHFAILHSATLTFLLWFSYVR